MRDVQTKEVHDVLVRRIVKKIDEARDLIADVEIEREEGATVGVLAYGATARPAKGAVIRARACRLPSGVVPYFAARYSRRFSPAPTAPVYQREDGARIDRLELVPD